MTLLLLCLAGFALGSVPTGLLVARMQGVDPRKTGSGNIGATNVLRSAGKLPALLTLGGDILKGVLAVLLARFADAGVVAEGLAGISSVLGHNFSVFLRFRGGKGVATSLGVLAAYAPLTGLVTAVIWLSTALASRYSSLSALVAFACMPVVMIFFDAREKLPAALFLSVMMFIRHKDNIARLLKGTEARIGKKA